ncbi:MAG TPA: ATP-binding cassette domain-containing protein [Candidatus Sulfopaludibacter sp.]|jgi:osmoprotectant transport system ATP-binding protein|nr:ATP-binding cassette domain-containing protein [Candidatus Sulfopaludibacter sp.]
MPAILEIQNLSYAIDGRPILRNVSLAVDEAETLVLLGRSGSGKTTLLKMVNRLLQPSSGSIRFEGKDSADWDPIQLRRRMGYVIQDAGLFPHWTVEANVGLVPKLERWPAGKARERVELLLNMVGLPPADYRLRYPRQLSGGQKQRVGIARALAADPPLLLLDEPFAALDPITRFDLQRQFVELRNTVRKASLFVTHDVREALAVASRIGLFTNGELALFTPREFQASQAPEARAFLATLEERHE